ncbi:MAG TPA: DUF3617 domain-containing protein [Bryobacteraceae bacterium]|nr:DUF3617 domain-containing protein [Bryobacteraceae bacterium]
MKILFGLLCVAGAAAWGADTIHIDARPGMWESTMTVQRSGMPPIPAELLAKLTPEQKAMMEARMKARESQPAKPIVSKRCVTQEDIEKGLDFGEAKGNCKRTVANATSSKAEFRLECEIGAIKTNGTLRVEALDPEHVKVSMHFTSGDGSQAMTIDGNGTAKWLGAACGATK